MNCVNHFVCLKLMLYVQCAVCTSHLSFELRITRCANFYGRERGNLIRKFDGNAGTKNSSIGNGICYTEMEVDGGQTSIPVEL